MFLFIEEGFFKRNVVEQGFAKIPGVGPLFLFFSDLLEIIYFQDLVYTNLRSIHSKYAEKIVVQ